MTTNGLKKLTFCWGVLLLINVILNVSQVETFFDEAISEKAHSYVCSRGNFYKHKTDRKSSSFPFLFLRSTLSLKKESPPLTAFNKWFFFKLIELFKNTLSQSVKMLKSFLLSVGSPRAPPLF